MNWKRTLLILLAACWIATPLAADWATGVAAFKSGDLEAAEGEFRTLAQSRPDWPGGHMMLGQTLLRDGRAAEALEPLKRAFELAPGDAQSALALGQAFNKLERFSEAAKTMKAADPAALPASQKLFFYRSRAAALSLSGRGAEAMPDLEAAVTLAPEDAELRRSLAYKAKAAGRIDLALTHYGRATELDPSDVASLLSLAQTLYGRAYDATEDEQSALCGDVMPYARRLVDLDERYEHLVLLGEVARCVGMKDVARDTFVVAAAKRPNDWLSGYRLGRAEIDAGDWSAAQAAFENALRADVPAEKSALVHGLLAYAFERQERLDEALGLYRLAGDTGGAQRVVRNLEAKKEELALQALAEEKARLERELAELEGSSGI